MRRYSFSAAIGVLALLASALSQGAFPGISLEGDARAAEGLAPEMLPVEIVRGAEDEIVNPGTKTFVNALSRELGAWWRDGGRAMAKNAWRVRVSQAYIGEGEPAGLLVSCCELRRTRKACSWITVERMRDPAASAELIAAAIIGTITKQSGREVTEK